MSVLVRTLFPHGWAAVGGLFAALIVVALVSVAWPGEYSSALLIAGIVVVGVAPIVVSRIAALRHPYFQTREDVEIALGMPVLGTCRARQKR